MKFRIWDITEKKMHYSPNSKLHFFYKLGEWSFTKYESTTHICYSETGDKFMHGLSLKDINGKDVYEGDIVEYRNLGDPYMIGYIVFEEFSFGIKARQSDILDFVSLHCLEIESIKVIGNIYENEEMI